MSDVYESPEVLAQYLNLHFGSESEVLSPEIVSAGIPLSSTLHFPQRCAHALLAAARGAGAPVKKALDLGCAVGGSSFELSSYFDEVVGIDLSQTFIRAAQHLQQQEHLLYQRKDQGKATTDLVATRPSKARPERIDFRVGDACNLSADLCDFDAVLMANLLCRVPDPRGCLQALWTRQILKPGGVLALVSPYSWLPEYTVPEQWLGGSNQNSSEEAIRSFLQPHFRFIGAEQMPVLIREHARKFQLIISHLTVWQRH